MKFLMDFLSYSCVTILYGIIVLKGPRVLGAQVEGYDEDLLVCSCLIGIWGSESQTKCLIGIMKFRRFSVCLC